MPKARKHANTRSEAMKAAWAKRKAGKVCEAGLDKKLKKLGHAAAAAVNLEREGIWSAEDKFVNKAEPIPPQNYRLRIEGFSYNRNLDIEIRGVPDDLGLPERRRLLIMIGHACKLLEV